MQRKMKKLHSKICNKKAQALTPMIDKLSPWKLS